MYGPSPCISISLGTYCAARSSMVPSTRSKPYIGVSAGSRPSSGSYTTVEPPAGWNTNTGAFGSASERARSVRTNPSIWPASRYLRTLSASASMFSDVSTSSVVIGPSARSESRCAILAALSPSSLGNGLKMPPGDLPGDDRPSGEGDPLRGIARRHIGVERLGDRLLVERFRSGGEVRLARRCRGPTGPSAAVGRGHQRPVAERRSALGSFGQTAAMQHSAGPGHSRGRLSCWCRAAAPPRRGARACTRSASRRCRDWRRARPATGSAGGRSRTRRDS